MVRYVYRIARKSDGGWLHHGTIRDLGDWDKGKMMEDLRHALVRSLLQAEELRAGDLDIEVRQIA